VPEQLDVDQRRYNSLFKERPGDEQTRRRAEKTEGHGDVMLPKAGLAGDEQKRQQTSTEEYGTRDIHRGPAPRR
jgi:hypothetical protein